MDASLIKLIFLVLVGLYFLYRKVQASLPAKPPASLAARKPADDPVAIPQVMPARRVIVKPPRRLMPPPLPVVRIGPQQPHVAPEMPPETPETPETPLQSQAVSAPRLSAAATRLRELLRDRESLRAALALREVLGPPRCMLHRRAVQARARARAASPGPHEDGA
jgi:hypothetical protein